MDSSLSDKVVYPTFVRTLPPASRLASATVALLEKYGWNRVVLMVGNHTQMFRDFEGSFKVPLYNPMRLMTITSTF